MKISEKMSFSGRLVRRNRILTVTLLLMLAYMIVVGELGLGDSRVVSVLAGLIGRVIFFGGMIWIVVKIIQNKKILNDRLLLKQEFRKETDELNRMLYAKSGGTVWDAVCVCQLFITLTASLSNMATFCSALITLVLLIIAKIIAYLYYWSHGIE